MFRLREACRQALVQVLVQVHHEACTYMASPVGGWLGGEAAGGYSSSVVYLLPR